MNELLVGENLEKAMTNLPGYSEQIREESASIRLLALDSLYQIYIPTEMSKMIYTKIYLAVDMALKKKMSKESITQQNLNYLSIHSKTNFNGVIGGGTSFSIVGNSGIGKSSAISRAINLISAGEIEKIETDTETKELIPILQVQTSFSCSSKGMLLEIIRQVDLNLGTDYMRSATRNGVNTDMLIGFVSQICLNHICVLVIDEIQHIKGHKQGNTLINMLTQLVNSSGISIIFVGTEEAISFFESKMQLARRTIGLHYTPMVYRRDFENITRTILKYIYTKECMEITADLIYWLYEHSAGTIGILISLIHDAQQEAIMTNDILDYRAFNKAYERMETIHKHIELAKTKKTKICKSKHKGIEYAAGEYIEPKFSVIELVNMAREEGMDILTLLKQEDALEVISV